MFQVYIDLHKYRYVFRLIQTVFITIISNATCFDQADHQHKVFILYKNFKTLGKKCKFLRDITNDMKYELQST
jgi:hypothetical protein